MGAFSLIHPAGASQARKFQIATTRTPRKTVQKNIFRRYLHLFSIKIPCFLNVFAWFCNGFLQSTVHVCCHKTVPKHHVLQCIQFLYYLPRPLKIALFSCFLQFLHVPLPIANSNIYKKSFQNIFFFQCVFVFFPGKDTVIYTFLAIKSVQNTSFCSVFNALASKNTSEYRYLRCLFTFCRFLECRKPATMTQNSMSIHFWTQPPKNRPKPSKIPPNSGLGAKSFLAPSPQLKLI